nr:hypothetical protein [Bacillaceae bacterium]
MGLFPAFAGERPFVFLEAGGDCKGSHPWRARYYPSPSASDKLYRPDGEKAASHAADFFARKNPLPGRPIAFWPARPEGGAARFSRNRTGWKGDILV